MPYRYREQIHFLLCEFGAGFIDRAKHQERIANIAVRATDRWIDFQRLPRERNGAGIVATGKSDPSGRLEQTGIQGIQRLRAAIAERARSNCPRRDRYSA